MNDYDKIVWHKAAERDDLDDGRVRTVTIDRRSIALSRIGQRYGALDNHCPHQGGPLGEGSIENGWLRCPWHGYDYDPITGQPPEGFYDAPTCFGVEVRDDGVYVALPARRDSNRTVGDVVVETLVAWGVTSVFGMVGHSNLGIADAMRRAEERGALRYIGIRHEGAAAFAASAYGKLTGRPAACLAIAGPGSTNLLTGLYDAKVDSAPVIALSGQVPSKVRGRGAFQDLDLRAAFADVAVSSQTLTAGSDHGELTALAVKHALDRRGVAHLVLPDEVQVQTSNAAAVKPQGRLADRRLVPTTDAIDRAVALIRDARRPMIIAGHGARGAEVPLLELARRLHAPIATTFKAKGLVTDTNPLAAGVLGRSGTPVASWLMNEADLLIVIGASFANHTGIATYKTVLQIDHDHESIGRFDAVDHALLGDASLTLTMLTRSLGEDGAAVDQRADIASRLALWRAEKTRRAADDRGHGVSSASVFESLSRSCPSDAVICVDVGNNTYSFGRYFEMSGQQVLMSGYLGSIGFGYPAALGAWAAHPERPILAITGDGGFGQYLAEVTTAVRYAAPIRHVVLDNSMLGKITKEQRAAEFDVWQTDLVNPDFARYTELCGARGIGVERRDQLDHAFGEMFTTPGPVTVRVRADPELV